MQFVHKIVKCNRTDVAEYNTEHDSHDSVYSAQCAVEKTQSRAKIVKCGFCWAKQSLDSEQYVQSTLDISPAVCLSGHLLYSLQFTVCGI